MRDSLTDAIGIRASALASRRRLVQFAGVGFLGTVVDNAVLVSLVELADVNFVTAKVLAWVVAIAILFGINDRWTFATFGAVGRHSVSVRLLRSYAVRFAGFLVTISVYTLLVTAFGVWYVAANLLGIAVGFVVNYTCESLYTWKVHQ